MDEPFSTFSGFPVATILQSLWLTTHKIQGKKTLMKYVKTPNAIRHYFCSHCETNLDANETVCRTCPNAGKPLEYLSLNLEKQLEQFFQDEQFCKMVLSDRMKHPNCLQDICDGTEYERLMSGNTSEVPACHILHNEH